jgi:hypothetical protein
MRITFTATLLGAVLVAAPAFPAGMNAGVETEYAGGTVVTIPVNTRGRLDMSDAQMLQFHYGKPTYKIDYSKITTLEVTEKSEPRLGRIGAKAMPFLQKKAQSLSIGFTGENGRGETVILEMAKYRMGEVLPVLEARSGKRVSGANGVPVAMAQKGPVTAKPASSADGGAFWGDRYWKTERNEEAWKKK